MKHIISILALALALVLPSASGNLARAEKKLNACGCYGEGNNCTCTRKAKCGCPGECEPKGCEEARQKKLQKEMEAEIKRAKEQEAANQPREIKPADEGEQDKASKGSPAKPMTPAMKKQFGKLIDAYLAAHPEWKNKMLWEVRGELP
jgi:hypothetical protein